VLVNARLSTELERALSEIVRAAFTIPPPPPTEDPKPSEITPSDLAVARAALASLTSRWITPRGAEAQEALAKFFATHRLASVHGSGVAVRYRSAMGLVSDMRQAMLQFIASAEDRLNEYAARESSR
jgi:hypothetical protein